MAVTSILREVTVVRNQDIEVKRNSTRRRIMLLSLLPVLAASLILILSTLPIMKNEYLITAVCLTLLMLSAVLYFTIGSTQEINAALRESHQVAADRVVQETRDLQETPLTVGRQGAEHDRARHHDEASRRKPEPLPNLSQEIRIPVNTIVGFTNLLLQTDLSGKQAEYLDTIKNSSESLLSVIDEILSHSRPSIGPNHRAHEHLCVLAVDDNQLNLKLVCTFLEDLGTDVTAAHSGEDAVKLAAANHFDLILMDIEMPGMGGIEAMHRIHDSQVRAQKVPVIAVTAHTLPDEIIKLLNAGMDDYVVKPISEQQLREKLDKWTRPEVSIPQAGETRDNSIVDWELGLRLANSKPDLAKELLTILKETLPDDLVSINSTFETEDTDMLLQQVHRLKGAVRYCGVPGLHEAVEQFDIALKAGDSTQAKSKLDVLNDEITVFMDWWNKSEHQIQ